MTLKNIITATLLSTGLFLGGCDKQEDEDQFLRGVITKESFLEGTGGFGGREDKYKMLVQLSDSTEYLFAYARNDARVMDMIYDVGDSISFREGKKPKIPKSNKPIKR